MSAEQYVQELLEERNTMDPHRYGHALRLINDEMIRVGAPPGDKGPHGEYPLEQGLPPPYKEEIVKLSEKVILPITEFPKFNFIGRLLGPGGSIMKSIADQTRTKVSILGKGSSKDKTKEAEMIKSDEAKHAHFKEPLHVFIQVEAPKSEGHARIADALDIIKECLIPREDEMGFGQPPPNAYGNDGYRNEGSPAGRGRGRGRGRGGRGEHAGSAPRLLAPAKDEYGYAPAPAMYDDSGPSHFDTPPRGGFRGEKRGAPANGYTTKKYREESYPPVKEEYGHFNAARY